MTLQPTPPAPADPLVAPAQAPAPASAPTPAAGRRRSSRLIDVALIGAAVLAIGGVAFAAGRATAPPAAAANAFTPRGGTFFRAGGSFDPGSGQGPRFGFGGGEGLSIDGTVTAIDADSVTIKTADGQERIIELDASTAYHQATDAAASDVAVGDDVSVKVSGGGGQGAAPGASGAPRLSASDVTLTH
jgi:hypothetical protein